jgi:ABC-type sugar transport system ATPase subunit
MLDRAPAPTSCTTGELAVSCRGVAKDFGAGAARVAALRGVELDVRLGAMTMLMGRAVAARRRFCR